MLQSLSLEYALSTRASLAFSTSGFTLLRCIELMPHLHCLWNCLQAALRKKELLYNNKTEK